MSKIQGKQVADGTITQNLLNLGVPTSGDTTSGATVGYVNARMTGGGAVTIGPAEDGEYTDGIFTDFTTGTTIGVAVDRFNEMFKLLAPTPPSGNWTGAFTSPQPILGTTVLSSSTRIIGTGAPTSNVVTTQTPSFSVNSSVGTGVNARTKDGAFVFTLKEYDGTVKETVTINSGSTTKLTGTLRYTIADPYAGVSGQQGFWTGCTGFSGVSFTSKSITAGVTPRNLYFEHPTGQSKTSVTFYVDNLIANVPSCTSLVMGTLPTMTRFVSGVPSLPANATFPITSFSIDNACTYFYSPSPMWTLTSSAGVNGLTGDITNILVSINDTGLVGSQTVTISNTYTESIGFTIQARNRSNVLAGSTSGFTSTSHRYDPTNESQRYISGSGLYPSVGTTYDSTESSKSLTTTNPYELQLINNNYKWPAGNWTTYGGPDYSSVTTGDNIGGTQWRWATFNLGSKGTPVNNITITVPGSIGNAWNAIKMYVKIGDSGWVDATVAQSISIPYNDGDYALDIAGSTAYNIRKVTFGTVPRSGVVYVRIGIKSTDTSFTFSLPTMD